jgi:uncharacterized protein YdaU (DUF1376 family)
MHYYQFNIGDYQSHTAHLSEIEDLAYRRLLDWYYLHESPIPDDIPEIARQIRMRTHTESIAIVLQEFFELTKKGWSSVRANREIAKTGEKSAKASASAKARWNKDVDANALQKQSESNATQDTRHITQDIKHNTQRKEKATVVACPPDVDQQIWDDWKQLRKAKKAPVTETVVKSARKEAAKANMAFSDFLSVWCARGSQGLQADWLKPDERNLTKTGQRNANVLSGLTRGLLGGQSNVKLLGN